MHTKVLRGLRIRDTPILDQPHSLKLELACKLPSLHDTPPVPSKHLTRCPRNRVQASWMPGEIAIAAESTNWLINSPVSMMDWGSQKAQQAAQRAADTLNHFLEQREQHDFRFDANSSI